MKYFKKRYSVVILCVLLLCVLSSCSDNKGSDTGATKDGSSTFNHSEGLNENGTWKDVKALDFVELMDYKSIEIPADKHAITDETVDAEVETMLADYSNSTEITDRAVADGDTLNIDFVGKVDGVEFDGGSSEGEGYEVTIGETSFIDDFLEQLIGHKPGENFDIEVTFPEDYGQDNLNGKDAVFNVTINHIIETVEAELTDEFVAENFTEDYGWTNISEMKAGLKSDLEKAAIDEYIQETIMSGSTIKSVPDSIVEYNEKSMISYYEETAASFGVELDEFLSSYVGVTSIEELIESEHDSTLEAAKYSLVMQAIAEDANITAENEDVTNYFAENMGSEDYSEYEEQYGMPYLKYIILQDKVARYLDENVKVM